MKKVFSVLSILLVFSLSAQAQVVPPVSSGNGSTSSVMPTGNSGAMANQTNNVDLSTGGVSLSIPIYSLGGRQLSTSVSLSYQTPSTPFWSDQFPSSWVGRDWALNAGGVIVREYKSEWSIDSVRGTQQYAKVEAYLYSLIHSPYNESNSHVHYERSPDIYFYNFDGYTGRFVINRENNETVVRTIPHSDLKIIPPNRIDDEQGIWTVYTPNGTVYTFGGEYVEMTSNSEKRYDYNVGVDQYGDEELTFRREQPWTRDVEVATSWYLNKINTPYQEDSIVFEYGDPYSTPFQQSTIQNLVNYETDKEEVRKYYIFEGEVKNQRRISNISSATGNVKFTERDTLIRTIEVKNKTNELIHKYELNYQRKDKYQFLVSCQEVISDCIKKPPYTFEYISGSDPDYPQGNFGTYISGSLKKIIYPEGGSTHFIYENNKADVTEWQYKNVEEKIAIVALSYADSAVRWIDVDHTQDMRLEAEHVSLDYTVTVHRVDGSVLFTRSISATTGVHTSFNFPIIAGKYKIVINHGQTLLGSVSPYLTINLKYKRKWLLPNTNVTGTGVRIKKITLNDGIDESKSIVKTYKYELENGISSGRLIAPPLIAPNINSVYDWRTGNFNAYAYNHYTFENTSSFESDPLPMPGTDIIDTTNPVFDSVFNVKSYKVYTMPQSDIKGSSQIQYTKVTEFYGENGEQGYVENYFSYERNVISNSSPLATIRDNSWKRGLPTRSKVFDKSGNLVSETNSDYEFSTLTTHPNQHKEYEIVSIIDRIDSYNPRLYKYFDFDYYNNTYNLAYRFGKLVSGSVFLNKTTTTNYDQDNSGNSITSSTEYEYSDKYLFPNRIIQNENNGDKTISESKYVLDYDLDQFFSQKEASTLKVMRDLHIITPSIEQTVWKQLGGQTAKQLLGASLNTYQVHQTTIFKNILTGGGIDYYFSLMPFETHAFEPINTLQPTLEPDFDFSTIASNELVWDDRYKKRVEYTASDRFGNIISAKEIYATPSTTIFGYNGLFPTAQISGASERQVAYENFELYGQTRHTDIHDDAFRGKYSSGVFTWRDPEGDGIYRYLIFPKTQKPIPNGTYTISFWSKGNGTMQLRSSYGDDDRVSFTGSTTEWNYNEKDIILSYDPIAHAQNMHSFKYRLYGDSEVRIDEIRVHPKGSFMSTTTYKPLVGVTHTTDTEQRTSSYYYDPLRRVESVRDHKNNLIKSYEYKYMSEDENSNPLFSINTTPSPEALIGAPVQMNVDQTELNRCLSSVQSYNHKWNFGDGSPLVTRNSTLTSNLQPHTYTQEGTYVITLSVEVVTGYWVDAHTSIRIIDPSSPSDLTNELTVTLNGTVDATNSLCYDLVATPIGGTPPFTYQWFSGDGTSNPTQTTAQINYCYTSFGNFTPRVVITDATGATADATFDLTVANPIEILTATIISNDSFCKGSCAFFDASVTGGTPAYTYLWEIINPYTNRNITLGTDASLSFKIPNPTPSNQYTIYLTVTDSQGREVITTKTVTVLDDVDCNRRINDPIIIDPIRGGVITPIVIEPLIVTNNSGQLINPTSISLGNNIFFTSTYIGNRYTYNWKIVHNGNIISTSSTPIPSLSFIFSLEGNYTITCTVKQVIRGRGLFGGDENILVGSNTINISICDALDLPRF